MLLKNVAGQGVYLYEYTAATGLAKTGDSANITGYYSLDDGTATVFATANPTEMSATHMPGVYWQPLAQSETNGNAFGYAWTSSTSGCVVVPLIGFTTGVSIPVAAPGAANGIFIAGTNAATTITTSLTTHLIGTVDTVTTVTNQVTAAAITAAMLTQALGAARALDTIADTSLTINDGFHCAIAAAAGKENASSGTSLVVQTPFTGTTLRTFTLTTSATNPFGSTFPVSRA